MVLYVVLYCHILSKSGDSVKADEIMLEDELAEYEDTEKRLERLDRRLRVRKTISIFIVAAFLFGLIIYAVRIERKLTMLAEQPPVIIYMNTETTSEVETAYAAEESTALLSEDVSADESKDYENEDINIIGKTEKFNETESVQNTPSTDERVSAEYYVTKSGTKYHRDGCTYLSKSKIPMSYEEIVAKGYKPCSRCIS